MFIDSIWSPAVDRLTAGAADPVEPRRVRDHLASAPRDVSPR
jgi:hypothetical protein